MTVNAHIETCFGLPVRDFAGALPAAATHAWRIATEYDNKVLPAAEIARLAALPEAAQVRALVIGMWAPDPSDDSSAVVAALLAAAPRLSALEALFIGDVTYEECEMSWLNQVDLGPLVRAFPRLADFACRGGNGLRLSALVHPSLRRLAVETGGLPQAVTADILAARLPALEHLELWLGSNGYGCDTTPEHLAPLLAGTVFPRLVHLGLRNADTGLADTVAAAVAQAPILTRLRSLDLSMGALTDTGGSALLRSPHLARLSALNLSHHYLTEAVQAQLRKAFPAVDLSDAQDPEEEYKSAEVTE